MSETVKWENEEENLDWESGVKNEIESRRKLVRKEREKSKKVVRENR